MMRKPSADKAVAITLTGGRVSEEFRSAVFDAAAHEGKSVNQLILEAAGRGLRASGYQFSTVFPGHRQIGEVH